MKKLKLEQEKRMRKDSLKVEEITKTSHYIHQVLKELVEDLSFTN